MSFSSYIGPVAKMKTRLVDDCALYSMPIGDEFVEMNPLIGRSLRLEFRQQINCIHCGRLTKKSFSQGYCYPCFQRLAQCDSCIVSPEKCHYFEGTCREPEWGESHCFRDHIVYLANSTGVKVGITRGTQVPTRWIDQGAVAALPIFRVSNRLQSGLVETLFKQHVADKTSWQAMLKGEPSEVDLPARRDELMELCQAGITDLQTQNGIQAIQAIDDATVQHIRFPVETYPLKVKSFNLDKVPLIEGTLMGIKGQYLIFDNGVINIRKYAGYHIELSCGL
ncbi:Uncharacterised protein [Zhongshania aliphaticivorans]|uniref:DUF2797 domain-containing protein n=1 Tax=Zhongshania aliphaticivorans TaxID=1470434 RepID=A0A5S9NCP8_9GAMM|nr:DUF2797 domain-containing protein [Zhongshania aliphaticivorans]CAA0087137.1 Uncharacterised protein [Zhongshania aliphaticivorans]CAA0114124.1 Uncharacterised protein [Zhongshania aliphaticivorans]